MRSMFLELKGENGPIYIEPFMIHSISSIYMSSGCVIYYPGSSVFCIQNASDVVKLVDEFINKKDTE